MSELVAKLLAELAPLSRKDRAEIAYRLLESIDRSSLEKCGGEVTPEGNQEKNGDSVDGACSSAGSPSASSAENACGTLNAKERQIQEDYEWCLHDPAVCQQYGGKVVVAFQKRILGAGTNHSEAWRTAVRNGDCPAKDQVAVVALLPKNDVADTPPYIFLGSQFLEEYRARLTLDYSDMPGGRLVIP